MRAKDNPAARAPGPRPFTAAEDEVPRETPSVYVPQTLKDLDEIDPILSETNQPQHETAVEDTADNPLIDPEMGVMPVSYDDPGIDTPPPSIEAGANASEWMPISTAPMSDPRNEIIVRWSTDDENGRLVSYKLGRRFNGRRWVMGGRWVPKDLQPLPVDEPIEWLRPADYIEPTAEAAA